MRFVPQLITTTGAMRVVGTCQSDEYQEGGSAFPRKAQLPSGTGRARRDGKAIVGSRRERGHAAPQLIGGKRTFSASETYRGTWRSASAGARRHGGATAAAQQDRQPSVAVRAAPSPAVGCIEVASQLMGQVSNGYPAGGSATCEWDEPAAGFEVGRATGAGHLDNDRDADGGCSSPTTT